MNFLRRVFRRLLIALTGRRSSNQVQTVIFVEPPILLPMFSVIPPLHIPPQYMLQQPPVFHLPVSVPIYATQPVPIPHVGTIGGDTIFNVNPHLPADLPVGSRSTTTYFGLEHEVFKAIQWGVVYNFIRDTLWGYLSIKHQGFNLNKTENMHEQMYAQFVYSSLAMIAVLLVKYSMADKKTKYSSDIAAIAGSSLAILSWDAAQTAAIKGFVNRGCSVTTANFLASLATGPAEGITVWGVSSFVARSLEITAKTYKNITNRETCHLSMILGFSTLKGLLYFIQRLLRGLIMSITVGALGGAVWQIVFTAMVLGNLEPLLGGLIIAIAVAGCNLFGGIFSNWTRKILIDYQERSTRQNVNASSRTIVTIQPGMWTTIAGIDLEPRINLRLHNDLDHEINPHHCARGYIPTFVGV